MEHAVMQRHKEAFEELVYHVRKTGATQRFALFRKHGHVATDALMQTLNKFIKAVPTAPSHLHLISFLLPPQRGRACLPPPRLFPHKEPPA